MKSANAAITAAIAVLLFFNVSSCSGPSVFAPGAILGPYSWSDNKGNWVQAQRGTIEGKRPYTRTVPIETIEDNMLGLTGAGISDKGDKENIRSLSSSERSALFRAIQSALADTGKAHLKLNYPGSSYKIVITVI